MSSFIQLSMGICLAWARARTLAFVNNDLLLKKTQRLHLLSINSEGEPLEKDQWKKNEQWKLKTTTGPLKVMCKNVLHLDSFAFFWSRSLSLSLSLSLSSPCSFSPAPAIFFLRFHSGITPFCCRCFHRFYEDKTLPINCENPNWFSETRSKLRPPSLFCLLLCALLLATFIDREDPSSIGITWKKNILNTQIVSQWHTHTHQQHPHQQFRRVSREKTHGNR